MATTAKTSKSASKAAKSANKPVESSLAFRPGPVFQGIDRVPVPGTFVCLGVDYNWPKDSPAKHFLDVPADWAHRWDGEFNIECSTFVDRDTALNQARSLNEAGDAGDGWHLIFEVGPPASGSFISLNNGAAAGININTSLRIVYPTADEIEYWC